MVRAMVSSLPKSRDFRLRVGNFDQINETHWEPLKENDETASCINLNGNSEKIKLLQLKQDLYNLVYKR